MIVAAKTVEPDPKLPGTIHSVVEEIVRSGGKAAAFQLDVQNDRECERCVEFAVNTFGSCDIVINNASALWWRPIEETPLNRFDLMYKVNVRGAFALTKAALPHMKKNQWGFVINMSPPVDPSQNLASRTAYSITKFGMTIVALGVADEYRGQGVAGHALWPATIVESSASENFQMGHRSYWRKADVLADSVLLILSQDPKTFTGTAWIDEDLLRDVGGMKDLTRYRCDPDVEPPTMKELAKGSGVFERGKALDETERAREADRFLKERDAKASKM